MSDSNLAYTEDVEINLRNDGFVQFQKDGVNSKVLMDQDSYDKMRELMDDALVEMVMAGLRDVENGRVRPAEESIAELRKKYGL
ncbi:MAG: hypothetical protein IJ592_00730 [Candidatus Methanomethylophilaceae archaeon]|nr:hypothetical protein [Candidatus Methanomethylophilaceae archaeon]